MSKRFQVFVSSTYDDLREERDHVIQAILGMGHIPVGMEMFSAADEEQWQTIKREIDNSDYYLLILAHRYGSVIEEEGGISYTEKEYDYAVSQAIPRIGFVIDNNAEWKRDRIDDGEKAARLQAFKAKVRGRPVDFWMDKQQLATRVAIALPKLIANTDRPGWERGTEGGSQVAATIARLTNENSDLREQLERLRALSQGAAPILDCQFSDAKGKTWGHILNLKAPDRSDAQTYIAERRISLAAIVNKIDSIQRETRQSDIILSTNPALRKALSQSQDGSRLLYKKYHFDYQRLDRVLKFLLRLEIDSPESRWQFDDLQEERYNTRGFTGPTSGEDLAKYKIFEELEVAIQTTQDTIDKLSYPEFHRLIYLSLMNQSRTAAESLTVRCEFEEEVALVFSEDLQSRPRASADAWYATEIPLVAPQDGVTLPGFILRLKEGTQPMTFNVRITGKNLPEAQIISLTVNQMPEQVDEADTRKH